MKLILQMVLLLSLLTPLASADTKKERMTQYTLDAVIKTVIQGTLNKVLKAETTEINNKKVHIIKILTITGRIQHIKIDANTGKVIDSASKD